ncbi:DDE superfamily endonuclease CENP-B-like protein [Macrophomina phaseolina MS6]|uniref:DDE superfamily endonuclease CENP-B-like protein n=1 Tax=Macrophomina phaseolina (strain MS6) TaxID=1126212 RepID=K2R5B3_MACPH|nr:DDE superfamily endonuclease CENP-B-like protein [Macrophomina phaseolina MS6]
MANKLLAERGAGTVGKNWPDRFIKRKDELKTCWTRAYDCQRALNEDPVVIERWFDLVRSVKEKYGILDEDTYNFDETGFMMGVIGSELVITGSERRWAVPPFTIFAGKNHINTWYEDTSGMEDWVIAVSSNGWTINELGVAWLKHFNAHTKSRTVAVYRLLIIDGHESYNSIEFQDLCEKEKIITVCMQSYSSHLLQPLDVGIFSPLKRAYRS